MCYIESILICIYIIIPYHTNTVLGKLCLKYKVYMIRAYDLYNNNKPITKYSLNTKPSLINHVLYRIHIDMYIYNNSISH